MPMRVAIYARVSTTDQTAENQLIDLRRYARERGWVVAGEFVDEGVSGTREKRPKLDCMMDAVRKRQVDIVLVWRFDRFARSVRHLVLALEELRGLDVAFVSYSENIDTSSPMGKAMFAIIGAMAELERNVLIERVHAGLRRARQAGKRIGRPQAAIDAEQVKELRQAGKSMREIAAALTTSQTKIFNILHQGRTVTKPPKKPTA